MINVRHFMNSSLSISRLRVPRARLVLAAVAMAMASLSLAADKEVEDLLAHMRDTYKAVKGAKFTVAATLVDPSGTKQETVTDFLYKPTNQVKATITGLSDSDGKALIIITDGKKIGFDGAAAGADKIDFGFDELEGPMRTANLEAMSFWDWDRQLSTKEGANMNKSTFAIVKDEKWDDKSYTVLEETATNTQVPVLVRYFIDPATYFIKRTVIYKLDDKKNATGDFKITKFDPAADISDSEFVVKD